MNVARRMHMVARVITATVDEIVVDKMLRVNVEVRSLEGAVRRTLALRPS